MIDIKFITDNFENTKKRLESRNPKLVESAQKVLSLQNDYKTALQELETQRSKRNEISKKIGMIRAKEGAAAAAAALKEANDLKATMQTLEDKTNALKAQIEEIMLTIPNLPDISVPVGADDKANVVVKENTLPIPQFNFKVKDHHEIGENLGILNFETASKLSGSRFALLCGQCGSL